MGKLGIIAGLCTGGSMDRASDSGSEGWGFESLPAYQKIRGRLTSLPLIFSPSGREGLEQFNAARMSAAGEG